MRGLECRVRSCGDVLQSAFLSHAGKTTKIIAEKWKPHKESKLTTTQSPSVVTQICYNMSFCFCIFLEKLTEDSRGKDFPVHVMKPYKVWQVVTALVLSLDSRGMWGVSFTLRPLHPVNESRCPFSEKQSGRRSFSGH